MAGEDLYGLAQSAGIMPQDPSMGAPNSGEDQYFNGVTTPGIGADAFGLSGRPGVMGGELQPPTAPLPLSDPQSGTTTVTGASASGSSFNKSSYDTLSSLGGRTSTGLGGEIDTVNKAADDRGQEEQARLTGPVNDANQKQAAAAMEISKAQADMHHQGGLEAAHLANLNDGFARDEARANADATAIANTAKASYMTSLMDLRASRVDPNQLWNTHTGGEQFGMLVTAFVHDFLGARGIHTSAMDSFNRAIDRNIDSQVNAIKTKGEVAAGFKTLWDMQRSQSASETEARLRMKGLLLESATQQATAHMAQYQSALATAQGHAAQAELDKKKAETLIDINKHIDDNSISLRKQNQEVILANRKDAIDRWGKSIQERELAQKIAQEKKNSSDSVIVNPETGYAAWEFAPNLEPGEMKTTRDLLANKGEMNKAFTDLRTLMRESKSAPDMIAGTRFAGTDQQRFDSITKRMAHSMVHANGERATDSDVVDYLQGMRPNTWGNQADADKVMAQTQKLMMRETDSYLQQRARDLPANDPRRKIQGAKAQAFAGTAAETDATLNPLPPTKERAEFDAAVRAVQEPSDLIDRSGDAAGKSSHDPWDSFNQEDLDTADSGANVRDENTKFVKSTFGKDTGVIPLDGEYHTGAVGGKKYNINRDDFYRPKQFEEGMVRLRDLAKSGKPESQMAIDQLARMALGAVGPSEGTGDHDDYRGLFALQMLSEIGDTVSSPDAVRQEAKRAK